MKRNALLLIFLCLPFFTLVIAQNNYTIQKNKRIKIGVSEHFKYAYDLNSGDSTLVHHVKYHKNGEPIKDYVYNEMGQLKDSSEYTFNSKGLRAKRTRFKDGKVFRIDLYNHDDQGNMIDHFQYDGEGTLLIHQKRKYNSKNENTVIHNKHRNGKDYYLAAKYKYTKSGKFESRKRFNPLGKIHNTSLYTYDEKDNCTSVAQDKGSGYQTYLQLKYDENNNLIERNFVLEKLTKQYAYDGEGANIEEIHRENNTLTKKFRYFYKKFE
ncbi:MAG: hypothetical protein Aureis2KO_31230 [Aureisphaera sp.]